MKYSKKFEQDYQWYKSVSDKFNFDGQVNYHSKKGEDLIQYDVEGKSAKECFFLYDSQGKIEKTNEPEELKILLRTKGSVNLHIKMYAESRADGTLPKLLFQDIIKEINPPEWFITAVENQKYKYYKTWKKTEGN